MPRDAEKMVALIRGLMCRERGRQVWCGRLWEVGCRFVVERVEEIVEETFWARLHTRRISLIADELHVNERLEDMVTIDRSRNKLAAVGDFEACHNCWWQCVEDDEGIVLLMLDRVSSYIWRWRLSTNIWTGCTSEVGCICKRRDKSLLRC